MSTGKFSSSLHKYLQLLQIMIQTPMIVDGLRRCADKQKSQIEKRGKNLLTFLIVTNLAMYVWETLETKPQGGAFEYRKSFYGESLWIVLVHLAQPLTIFYRFHSAVALADIWNSAYNPGDYH